MFTAGATRGLFRAQRGGALALLTGARSNRAAAAASLSGISDSFGKVVVPSYARYDIQLDHGKGSRVWDAQGKEYLDFAGGIAVNSLGHAHPDVVETIQTQCTKLMHCSNLYYTENQLELARSLVQLFGGEAGSKAFFCNSGVEANEALFKLARKVGEPSGRYEIITAVNSFHGRTLGGISATGQDKIKKGFGPLMPGFRHVPFNDLEAAAAAVGDETAAIMIEGIQGEGGVTPASADYLLGLRELCDKHNILLLVDAVQCGHFRSGSFQSYERILEDAGHADPLAVFRPDACSMAKSLGAGFPIGAIWVSEAHANALDAGSHGTTYGGNPLACAVARTVIDVVKRDGLEQNVRSAGARLKGGLAELAATHPDKIVEPRGLGLMLGLVMQPAPEGSGGDGAPTPAARLVAALHERNVLTVPAGPEVVRFLPALNVTEDEVDECLAAVSSALAVV